MNVPQFIQPRFSMFRLTLELSSLKAGSEARIWAQAIYTTGNPGVRTEGERVSQGKEQSQKVCVGNWRSIPWGPSQESCGTVPHVVSLGEGKVVHSGPVSSSR